MCIFWLCLWELNTHSTLLEEAQKANLKNEMLSHLGYEIGWKQHCLLACVNIVEHSEFWRTDEVFWAGCVMMEIAVLEGSKFLHITGMLQCLAFTPNKISSFLFSFVFWWEWQKQAKPFERLFLSPGIRK